MDIKPYAGIGSRETPADVLEIMRKLGFALAKQGYKLRSGGANGADAAFEKGCIQANGVKRIFLPWDGFNEHWLNPAQGIFLVRPGRAYEIAERYHPNWNALKPSAKNLMARNTHQILGYDCWSPSAFVVCWTKNGSLTGSERDTGGTGQALRIAVANSIPVFNIYRDEHRVKMVSFLDKFSEEYCNIPPP